MHSLPPASLHDRAGQRTHPDRCCADAPHAQVGASFGAAALVGCLLAMAFGPALDWADWAVAAVFAAATVLYSAAAAAGPLQGVIGRRGVYERRAALYAELAKQVRPGRGSGGARTSCELGRWSRARSCGVRRLRPGVARAHVRHIPWRVGPCFTRRACSAR
jgi:hypothetical protein